MTSLAWRNFSSFSSATSGRRSKPSARQSSSSSSTSYFIGKLGTDALAGVALVFPVVMLMQMMSAGAMGGGIASAIARALGGGRRAEADALALHALVIALAFGAAFMLGVLGGGRAL